MSAEPSEDERASCSAYVITFVANRHTFANTMMEKAISFGVPTRFSFSQLLMIARGRYLSIMLQLGIVQLISVWV